MVFNLTKIVSSSSEALQSIADTKKINEETTQRVLGVHWDSAKDILFVKAKVQSDYDATNMTLHKVLSSIATLFDPLGFVRLF